MQCGKCNAEFEATNQHSECPHCGAVVGTSRDHEDDEELERGIKAYEAWETGTQSNRELQERDRDYYDGDQYTPEERAVMADRGQPIVVKNRIAKKLNFLFGTEVQSRTDPKALPRTAEHDTDAEAITDAMRYVADDQDVDYVISRGYDSFGIEGECAAVVETEIVRVKNPVDTQSQTYSAGPALVQEQVEVDEYEERVEIRVRHVKWDRLWYDIHSREPDFSDAEDKGIVTWYYIDRAKAFYAKRSDVVPNYEQILDDAMSNTEDSGDTHDDKPQWSRGEGGKKRIKVVERYYRKGGVWYTCHYVKGAFLVKPKPTGYVDDEGNDVCPLLMTSCFVDRQGMRYGYARNMIGPQDIINKTSSKAMHQLNVNRIIAEKNATESPEEARIEAAKPDGYVMVQHNALAEGRFVVEKGSDMAAGQFQLLQEAKLEIDTIGPEIPQIGSMSGDASGRAIMARQNLGSLEIAKPVDNFRRWKRMIFTHIWWRIRQFWTGEMWLRVRDDAQAIGYRFVALNRRMTRGERFMEMLEKGQPPDEALRSVMKPTEAQRLMKEVGSKLQQAVQANPQLQQMPPDQLMQKAILAHPVMQSQFIANDVARVKADVVIDESPDVAVLQQEEFMTIADLLPKIIPYAPQLAQPGLEALIEASSIRTKKRFLEVLRKPPDPQQVQMQQKMMQIQTAGAQAGVQVAQSQAQLNQAKAAKEAAEAQIEPPKGASEIELNRARAVEASAKAGEKIGSIDPIATQPPGGNTL